MPDATPTSVHDSANDSREVDAFVFPASFAQRRLWFVDRLDPGSPVYNAAAAFRVAGPLRHAALEAAVNCIVARHESLRTTFRMVDGEPSQVIAAELRLRMPAIDLRTLPPAAREAELVQLIQREERAPFDLATGPLLRLTHVQLDEADHALLVTLHHIVTDMWSQEIFMRELTAFYVAFEKKQAPELPALPIQYADFAHWQREQFQGALLERELSYWKQKLDGLAPLELPLSHPRPATSAHRGKTVSVELPEPLTASLRQLAAREGVSLFMLFLAAWKVLLFRYTSHPDVSVGSPISNRNREETEPLIGFFLNMLVLRTELGGSPTFRELLARVRDTVLGAFEHQEIPFEMLVESLHPARVAGRNPLFNVAFVLVHGDANTCSPPGLTFTPIRIEETLAKFDLTLSLNESGGKMDGTVVFNAELFEVTFIAEMAAHFRTVLEGIAANPEVRIDTVPILGDAERVRLVSEWNRTVGPFPAEKTVAALFEDRAALHPTAVAIAAGDRRVSYGDLNRSANQRARHLRTLGVTRGMCVGVCLERSLELIEWILAIVKAGGAYVPLEAASPPDRLAQLLDESDATVVLTRSGAAVDFSKGKARVVRVDAVDLSHYEDSNPGVDGTGDDLAYVIFTSGSTGRPKGVAVPHRAIARLVSNTDYVSLGADDVVAHVSNVAFDAATFEIWGALLNGATLAVAPQAVVLSPGDLAEFLAGRGITALFLTTALFNQIARQAPAAFRPLRHLLFGGEAGNPDCVRRVLLEGAPHRLVHVYGPTEATTFATWHLVREVLADAVAVPIGQPIANTTIHLLDARLQPVPCGVAGEIFIGGPGLALGYRNDPQLTAERFLDTEFGRLYRTGDLARRRADGAIEFCGRIDAQVKLRGYRIEPVEIESALQQHPSVRHAAIVAQTEGGAAQSLIGYLVPQSAERSSSSELREFLAQRLPSYMIPSAFLWVEAFPLTANGKLDMRNLPHPEATAGVESGTPVAPRNEIERTITALWGEVLGSSHLSPEDDFFLVGGHSILAIQLLARMREKLGVDVPVRRLFETPTIRGLAEFVSEQLPAREAKKLKSIVMIQRGDETRVPMFIVPGGWGGELEFLVYGQLARQIDPELPFHGLRLRGSNTEALPNKSVEEFAASFVADVCAFHPDGPYLIGGECVGGVIAYEMARQLEAAGREVTLLLLLDTEWPNRASFKEFLASERKQMRAAEWEARVRQPAIRHWQQLRRLSVPGKMRYLWTRLSRSSTARTPQPEVSERDLLTEYPRKLKAHALQPHRGKVTLILDQHAHDSVGSAGWDTHHPGKLEIHVVPGDHVSYIREHSAATAATLRGLIDHASQPLPC